ncbi:putative membrane protein, partial [Vibrio parahaemolyticus VPTS-2010_2]
MYPVI